MATGKVPAKKVPLQGADATPSKKFFVDMLTRDIELKDSLLDLLDNCLDGAMRQTKGKKSGAKPYQGYWAKISFDKDKFVIEDNCGGIPPDIARTSAFRLGRTNLDLDKDLPTVGVYGIGMKRAIFKMGRNAAVESNHSEGKFTVAIDRKWMEKDNDWKLPMSNGVAKLTRHGTKIVVDELRDGVSRLFSDETGFENELRNEIANYYGYIIDKGFEVTVNGKSVSSSHVTLILDRNAIASTGIAPYVYETSVDGVDVSVIVGFYRDLPSAEEEEDTLAGRPSTEKAGVTIICNDRVVVYADKTRLTGWGTATVPQYHTQFVSIAGTVVFKSNDAGKLPLTTTKRGLDASSDLYLGVREAIQEGLKYFTDYTNKWKGSATDKLSQKMDTVAPRAAAQFIPQEKWSKVNKGLGGRKFRPSLPLPKEEDPPRFIRFAKPLSEIKQLASYAFDDATANPSDVGVWCFDQMLKKAMK